MPRIILAAVAALALGGCGTKSSAPGAPQGSAAVASCLWTADTCDQYGGTVDPTFLANLETTCGMHGTAFASGPCPTANQVSGHCQFAAIDGRTDGYYYYAPTYDSASARTDCLSGVIGVTWIP